MRDKYIQIAEALYPIYVVYRCSNDWGFCCGSSSVITFIADNKKHSHGILGFNTLEFSPMDSAYGIEDERLMATVHPDTSSYSLLQHILDSRNFLVQNPYAQ